MLSLSKLTYVLHNLSLLSYIPGLKQLYETVDKISAPGAAMSTLSVP